MNGKAIGFWKRSIEKGELLIDFTFFTSPNKEVKYLIEKKVKYFGSFLDKKITINYHS